jgi:hypothetical protein
LKASQIDGLLEKNKDKIKSFSWVTSDLARQDQLDLTSIMAGDYARLQQVEIGMYAASPDIFSATLADFLQMNYRGNSGLSYGEQLYTARGSQGGAVGSFVTQSSLISPSGSLNDTMLMDLESSEGFTTYYRMRPVWTADQTPKFTMTDRASMGHKQTLLTSIPMWAYHWKKSLRNIGFENLMINPKSSSDQLDLFLALKQQIQNSNKNFNSQSNEKTLEQVVLILDIIFSVIIVITMFLCFFSLSSAMTANLYEQAKELAVLRSIGNTKWAIRRLYMYEAFILVFASCLLGVLIGTVVGFTMTLQQVLFTQIPLVFYFPWAQFILILALSFLCAMISTIGPSI